MDTLIILLFLAVVGLIYVAPAFIAFARRHPNRWIILVICIVFGATLLGWLVALVWSLSAVHRSPTGNHGGESGLNLFVNDLQTVRVQPTSTAGAAGAHKSAPAASGGSPMHDPLDQLVRLKDLLDRGVLEQEEYDRLKAQVLAAL